MKFRLALLLGLVLLAGCSSPEPTAINYVVSLSGTPGSGFSAFYRIGSGAEVAISSSLPQTITVPAQPSGTGVSARVRLTSQGNVTLTVSTDGELCGTRNPVHSGGPGETVDASVVCTR